MIHHQLGVWASIDDHGKNVLGILDDGTSRDKLFKIKVILGLINYDQPIEFVDVFRGIITLNLNLITLELLYLGLSETWSKFWLEVSLSVQVSGTNVALTKWVIG